MFSNTQINVIWEPHPKQEKALESPEFEVLYGGARGGGKTDAGLAWMMEFNDHAKFRGLVLRRNGIDLKDWIDRANQLYSQFGAVQKGNPAEFHWPSGAIIRTGHLQDENAYTKYMGHEYHKILIEEATHIPDEKSYLKLLSSARSTVPELKPQVFLTTNPGSKGHMWVKKRFVDPAPPGTTMWYSAEYTDPITKTSKTVWKTKIYIPATIDDNPTLIENDPEYVANIEALKGVDDETYMAWRFGDWDRFVGQVFSEFDRNYHVVPRMVPQKGTHYLWMDWGYSDKHESSFSCYLSAVVQKFSSDGQKYNQVVTYKEICGNRKNPEQWAEIIYNTCKKIGVTPKEAITDPNMHNPGNDMSISIAEQMRLKWKKLNGDKNWINLSKGNNSRVGKLNRVAMVHKWLSIPDQSNKATLPYWVMTEDCKHLIRTLPMLVYSDNDPEDIDTDMEDHPYDACSYGLSRVKFTSVKPGAFDATGKERVSRLSTDENGLPIINPKTLFSAI